MINEKILYVKWTTPKWVSFFFVMCFGHIMVNITRLKKIFAQKEIIENVSRQICSLIVGGLITMHSPRSLLTISVLVDRKKVLTVMRMGRGNHIYKRKSHQITYKVKKLSLTYHILVM